MRLRTAFPAVCAALLCGGMLTGCLFDFEETARQIIHGGTEPAVTREPDTRTREDIVFEIHRLEQELAELDAQEPPFDYEPEGNGVVITKARSDTLSGIPAEIAGRPVVGIGEYACSGVFGIHDLEIPATVTHIDDYAFTDSAVESVLIAPDSTLTIGEYAFEGCSRLSSVVLGGETEILDYAFEDSGISELVFTEDCRLTFGGYVFENCGNLNYLFFSGKFSIGEYAFLHCGKLETVLIQDADFRLDDNAFTESGLQSIHIERSRGTIGAYAFQRCTRLSDVWLQSGVTAVGKKAFAECSSLESVYFASSVRRIGEDVFAGCYHPMMLSPEGSAAQQYAEEHEIPWSAWDADSE